MNNLREIRRQLKSVENIKKITDTMERVAAARLRQAQAKAEQSRPFISKLKEILENVAASDISHPLFVQREVKKIGVAIITGDKGLSGSYNSSIFSAADKFLKKNADKDIELIVFGKKGLEHYQRREWKIRCHQTQWVEKNARGEMSSFSKRLVNLFLQGELDEIWLIYTHFISIMRREVIVEKFLNIQKTAIIQDLDTKSNLRDNYIFEPDADEILSDLLPRYCDTKIQTALFEAYASELSARIVAMQTASKNSEDMIDQLTLVKNKTRQRDITREMIEITSGSQGRQ
jgi:F-type H+-transporting ATPase subunit gamma